MSEKKRILSGIQPSGRLHLGNYFGMMKRMIEYQDKEDLFCFLVNYHALTTISNGNKLRKETLSAAMDFLALGIDPEKSYFWVQSDIPEVTELTWILSNVTPLGLLERCHSYKDKVARGISPSHGLFAYPVLMAADILIFQSNIVPVGKDQKQHVEVARDIAIKFNNTYGDTFVIPEEEIQQDLATVPGLDGQKMAKSYDNTVEIFADEKTMKQKVMSIVTDSTPVDQPKNPETCNLFAIYKLFANEDQVKELDDKYRNKPLKYSEIKKELFGMIWEYFAEARQERKKYENSPGDVINILKKGAGKARKIAGNTLQQILKAVGLNYFDF
ncbi:MAG: tryptophan--tRNA ligase [Nitrospinota bacterium]|jgi:tryptophanyl-tRNA synthetase|nr:tryptophan--tRNA ligase [Nitrospinota bacterium]MDP7580309.1 tryptophan--tRNA ligase [Nitrospinota bacterium]HJN02298.1 tryptophan--tRNA ligase [Nitrospinota bacterium]